MPTRNPTAAVALLVGADTAAVDSLQPAAEVLASFGIGTETAVVAVHQLDASRFNGICAVIVASPDGLLPGAVASVTELPVIRVPGESADRSRLTLLIDANGNLPCGTGGEVFATMAIGLAGAKNAALFVVASLAVQDERLRTAYADYRASQTDAVLNHPPLDL